MSLNIRGMAVRPGALAVAAGLVATPALAWNNQGHMAVGEIAYDQLIRSRPEIVHAIVEIAGALPRRQVMDAALRTAPKADRDRLVFAYLARWPDDIRGTEQDRPDHHYRLRGVSDIGGLLPLRAGHADREYAQDRALLADRKATVRDEAIALAWMFHIVGDMHQPLHSGTWLSWTYPKSDRAGTIAFVRHEAGGQPDDLHNYWDGCVDRPGTEIEGAAALAADVERRYPRAALPELKQASDDFATWAQESAVLARRIAYQDGGFVPGPTRAAAPVVTRRYALVARIVSDRRVATAGYRLSDVLSTAPDLRSAP